MSIASSNASSPFNNYLARETNKIRAGIWNLIGGAADVVDKNVAQPLVTARAAVAGQIDSGLQIVKKGGDILGQIATHWQFVLVVVALVAIAYAGGPILRKL